MMGEELPGAEALWLFLIYGQVFELFLPVLAIAGAMPKRPRFCLRAALTAAVVLVGWAVPTLAYYSTRLSLGTPVDQGAYSLASSAALLVAAVPVVMTLFEASVWSALFCASAGYTIQNIASGLSELVVLLLERIAGVHLSMTIESTAVLSDSGIGRLLVSLFSIVSVFAFCYLVFIRKIRGRGLEAIEDRRMSAMLGLVILAVIAFDVVIKSLTASGAATGELVMLRLVHLAVCAFVLFVEYEMLYGKALEAEVGEERRMAAERERQYRLSRENVDAINLKFHDIRHQIRKIADGGLTGREALEDIAHEIDVYDAQYHTGNDALDTVLTEKGLVCEREAIELTCIADGSTLDFMTPAEIYSLFGNALDNALQATRAVDDPERRSISLVVRRAGNLATIHVENYFVGERRFSPDGLPVTTQRAENGHGYGTRSMRQIVERHGGTLALGTRGDVFTLDAMIPVE